MNYKNLTLQDREKFNAAFRRDPRRQCESSFGVTYLWKDIYKTTYAEYGNFFILKYTLPETDKVAYAFPFGDPTNDEALKDIIELLKAESEAEGHPLFIGPMVKEDMERMERVFPDAFEFFSSRNEFDYLYSREKLATLAGKKLHGKRNHIARFKDNPNWAYEEITDANIAECVELDKIWLAHQLENGGEVLEAVIEEQSAVHYALKNLKALGLTGGAIRRDGKLVAFSIGEPLTEDTYDVHIEKALGEVQGAYAVMNQEFVLHNCEGFTYVNREDDNGDEGLRRSKLSYYPEILLEKFVAKLK